MRAGPRNTGRTAGMLVVVWTVAVLVFGSSISRVELLLGKRAALLRCLQAASVGLLALWSLGSPELRLLLR